MAVVLIALGYFLIWPVLLLLINSFNAASDWFVEPRTWGVKHWDDGWTAITADGKRSAQMEHTVLVGSDGAEILTLPSGG